MKLNSTMLALSLGLWVVTASAQTMDLGPDATSYRRFLIYPHLEKGFDALAREDRGRALAEFEQARALAPDNPAVALHLARAYRHFGEPARAEAVLREQLTRNPGNKALSKALDGLRARVSASELLPALPMTFIAETSHPTPDRKPRAERAPKAAARKAASHVKAMPSSGALVRVAARDRQPAAAAPHKAESAYAFADRAYKASGKGQHAAAVLAARQAVRLAPDNRAYRSLLVYELMETGQLEEADTVASQAPPPLRVLGDGDELLRRQKQVRERMAFTSFEASRRAAAAGQIDAAAQASRQAIAYSPGLMSYRLQLVGVLLAAHQWPEAEQAASQAIRDLGPQPALLGLRAYALQRAGQRPAAASDLDMALAGSALSADEQQTLRFMATDAALSANEPQKALDLLAPLALASGTDAGVNSRRAVALQLSSRDGSTSSDAAAAPAWLAPRVICDAGSSAPVCDVRLGEVPPDPAYPAAEAAYQAFSAKNYDLAASRAQEAVTLSPDNRQYRTLRINALMAGDQLAQADQELTDFLSGSPDAGDMLALRSTVRQKLGQPSLAAQDAEAALRSGSLPAASQISMLVQLDRKQEARERFAAARSEGAFASQSEADTAYLALQTGDDAAALNAFGEASSSHTLPDSALQDAAYAAGRLGRNEESVDYFKRAIDASEAGQFPLAPQKQLEARRAIADRSRNSGVYGSVTYRGISPSGFSLTPGAPNDSIQSGVEAYWRPFGYRDGRLVELYGGLTETLYSKAGLTTGAPSAEAALGARVKPLADANLVFALERRLAIGAKAQTDWLARAGYSWSQGMDLRVDRPDWWSAQVYAEAGRFIQLKQNFASFEGQAGRSFRLDAIHPRLVIFPHLVLGADRNTGYQPGQQNAVGAGVGTSLRYWFNEDKYNAPRSYWDVSLQYRGRISGDERGKGVFLRVTLSY